MDIYTVFAFIALIGLNAIFVAAEFSLARVRKTKIEHIADSPEEYTALKVNTAKLVKLMLKNINDYISVCQIGITVASLALGAVAESSLVGVLEPMIHQLNLSINPHSVSLVLAITLVTIVHVIIGEVVPKNIAIINPEAVIFKLAHFLKFLHFIFKYPVKFLNFSSSLCLKALGIKVNFEDDIHTEDELRMIISNSLDQGVLDELEEQLMQNIFDFSEITARNVMIPQSDIIYLDAELSITEAIDLIEENTFSRFPVFELNKDNVIGFVNLKDLLMALRKNQGTTKVKNYVRELLKVTDAIYVMDLIQLMQKGKHSIAILIDEFGGVSGMLTVEDIIEEVFGEIEDEGEISKENFSLLSKGEYLVNGLMSLKDFNELLDLDLKSNRYDTIGGFVFGLFGFEPKVGDEINRHGISFIIEKTENNRIKELKAIKISAKELV